MKEHLETATIKIKQRHAESNAARADALLMLKNKRVLSVGFGHGFEIIEMAKYCADVYGVEPDSELYDLFLRHAPEYKDKVFNTTVQDIPDGISGGKFDVIVIFLWNVPFDEKDTASGKIAGLLKDDGQVLIGMHDGIYVNGDEQTESITTLMKRYFHSVNPFAGDGINRLFLRISGAREKALEKGSIPYKFFFPDRKMNRKLRSADVQRAQR